MKPFPLITAAVLLLAAALSGAETERAVGGFDLKNPGRMARYPAELTARLEGGALVFHAILQHPDVMGIRCLAAERNQHSWEDESLELFILPAGAGEEAYLHIAANADGVVFAERGTGGPANFDSTGIAAATRKSRETGSWELELTIPRHLLGSAAAWDFNFIRTVRVGDRTLEISSWSKLELGAHEPYNFGRLAVDGGRVFFLPKVRPLLASEWNGGFEEELAGWRPMVWTGGDHYGEGEFSHAVVADAIEGERALRVDGRNLGRPKMEGGRGGVLSAPIALPPGKYLLSGYYKCVPGDFVPIDGQLVSVFVPGGNAEVFLPASAAWRRFEVYFELAKAGEVAAMLRLWTNGSAWFDAVSVGPAPKAEELEELPLLSTEIMVDGVRFEILQYPQEPLTEAVATRVAEDGLAVYQRDVEKLQPDSVPAADEMISEVALRALPGMAGVEFLTLYGTGEWRVDIASAEGWFELSRIPFWLQRTGYDNRQAKWVAEVLYPLVSGDVVEIAPDRTGVLALSWRVPETAAAGVYRAELRLTELSGAHAPVALPVTVAVAGEPLPETPVDFGLWVAPNHVPKVLPYVLAGGVEAATFPLPLEVVCDPDGGNVRIGMEAAIERLRQYEAAGMLFPVPAEMSTLSTDLARAMGIYGELPRDSTFDSSHLICPADAGEYPEALTRAFRAAVRSIHAQLVEAGFDGKVLFYVADEPTSNPHRMFKAAHEGAIVKEECSGVEVFMTAHDLVRTERLAREGALDVVCLSLGILTANPEWAGRFYAMAERNGLKVWAYTGSTGESYAATRRLGFLAGGERIERLMMWVSYFDNADLADPLNDLKGPLKRVATFYPSPSGYRSTIQWEGVKDGLMDLRLLEAARRRRVEVEGGDDYERRRDLLLTLLAPEK